MLSLRPACRIDGAALASLECQGRYITRPALAMNALRKLEDGPLALETPPDPRTIDRILRHRQSERCRTEDPFEPRAPPLFRPYTVQ